MLIECPSGLTFRARKWKIGDRRILRDRNIVKQGLHMRKMLECVDEGVERPGPYDFEQGKKVPWAKVATVDIVDALIDIRVVTRSVLDYTSICKQCGAKMPLSIDLKQIERVPMPATGRDHLTTNVPVECVIPHEDGEIVAKVRLLRGEDMPRLIKQHRQKPELAEEAQMIMHVNEVTTPKGDVLTDTQAIWDFYADQDWEVQEALSEFVDDLSGGIDTRVDAECNQCNSEQDSVIPFAEDFFYPRKKAKSFSTGTF